MKPRTIWMALLLSGIFWLAVYEVVMYVVGRHASPPVVQAATTYNPKQGDPCAINLRATATVNLLASGQLIAGVTGKKTYICSMLLVNAAAQNVAIVEGTGAVCATNTAGMAGGATAATGFNLGANQAIATVTPGYWSMATATTGDNVCLLLSGTTQLSGFLQYAQY